MGRYLADVLVIEDDELLSIQLGELLRLQGYAVRLSGTGESGLAMALADAPDLVLLDVMLPDINGLAVLRRLREQQQTPVIMLTACGAEEERIRGLRHGADDYLSKPFNLTELQRAIDRARAGGYRALHLDVLSDNPAVGLYTAMGLTCVAETIAPDPCRVHGIPMEMRMAITL